MGRRAAHNQGSLHWLIFNKIRAGKKILFINVLLVITSRIGILLKLKQKVRITPIPQIQN